MPEELWRRKPNIGKDELRRLVVEFAAGRRDGRVIIVVATEARRARHHQRLMGLGGTRWQVKVSPYLPPESFGENTAILAWEADEFEFAAPDVSPTWP